MGLPAGILMETREERLSSYSVSMLSAGQISCHIAEGETAEDWRGWFHLNNFMLWLAELNAHRHKTSTSEEDRSGKKKSKDPGGGSYVKHNHLALRRGKKKKKNIKWEWIHISTEEISDSLGSFFFSSRQKDNLYLCVSLLLLWLLCFLNFWLDWLKWLRSASTKKKQQKNKKKKHHKKKRRQTHTWRSDLEASYYHYQPWITNQRRRTIEGQHQWNRRRENTFFFNLPQAIPHHCIPHRSN